TFGNDGLLIDQPDHFVFVKGFAKRTTKQQLEEKFAPCGTVQFVSMTKRSRSRKAYFVKTYSKGNHIQGNEDENSKVFSLRLDEVDDSSPNQTPLIAYEKGLPNAETPQVMMIRGGKIQKTNKKSRKAKGRDDTCHHCKEVGHWKKNYLVYLVELLKKQKLVGIASSSSIFIIKLFAFPNNYRVYDTSFGNGVCAQVEAIGSYDLVLPNGLVIYLENFSKNSVFYFNAIPINGIYDIDMHDLVPNDNSIYNVSTKRVKHNLDSTYRWHCRLAHISKKRIEKLQQEGLLKSTYDELFDQCVSCLSGKMTRKSFPHRPKRATNLPGIIHTDVCGPLRHVSRQDASYFITFMDDNSRYGYVYLLKHKHEDYALESATRILNMVPTKKVDKIPYELWYGKVPNLSYLKVWGCEDLGEAAFILGIIIYRDRSKRLIGLGQNAYMDKILKRYKMDISKHGHIPMQKRLDLNKTQGASTFKEVKRMKNVPYASVVGSIMYDWTGKVYFEWRRSATAMSATKAEYIAASEATMEAVWIRKFILRLGIVPTINEAIRMFCDNLASRHFANESGVQRGVRHYHRRYHYVRESIALGEIRFLKVCAGDNLANPSTKALSNTKLTQHARSMGLRLASSFM
nr:hypothetical protein [Tanacetum cinerariifolium]